MARSLRHPRDTISRTLGAPELFLPQIEAHQLQKTPNSIAKHEGLGESGWHAGRHLQKAVVGPGVRQRPNRICRESHCQRVHRPKLLAELPFPSPWAPHSQGSFHSVLSVVKIATDRYVAHLDEFGAFTDVNLLHLLSIRLSGRFHLDLFQIWSWVICWQCPTFLVLLKQVLHFF